MTQSISEIERDIEETRARLDQTIDRIQDRLSVSGIVDEIMGSMRKAEYNSLLDNAMSVVRRNPVPVILVAAGVGWLIHRMSARAQGGNARFDPYVEDRTDVPLLNTGNARIYDPDASTRHPNHDLLESRRDVSARA